MSDHENREEESEIEKLDMRGATHNSENALPVF